MFRFVRYCFYAFIIVGLLGLAASGGALYYLVVVEPGPEMDQGYIEAILGRESPVLYSDGQKKIGVLFQDIHRQYLTYDKLPKDFINAIVAAEDDQFFSHYGIDIPGITRAMVANIKAGRVVQGGSTLTQQTAKNLFKRESRSYQAKLKELLFALRLEYWYSKEKILEFYCNQFFVSGNGHGLGVAARYYFDKDVDELGLTECAFIAGSVKRPNYYNPFSKRNSKNPAEVSKRIELRTGYVLAKMFKAGIIDQNRYNQTKVTELPFSQGKMAFSLNTVMDLVKDELQSPAMISMLEEHGIANVSTSGIRIITSIDQPVQRVTLQSLRKHLSHLDVRLRGYDRKTVQSEYEVIEYPGDSEFHQGAFLFGTIEGVRINKETGLRIRVSFGDGRSFGVIDSEGVEAMLLALAKYHRDRWAKVAKSDREKLLSNLKQGDHVYVSIRKIPTEGDILLDLERFPELQGAALVTREGAIRAMVGGVTNRFFNRAMDAKRLMGSTFKPFVFSAALQLGWSSVDPLDNRRDVFVFMNKPYFPRPDHKSPFEYVSMSWAGVTSENVAAVWLLYHLADYLTPPRIRELAEHLDMAPRSNEDGTESYQGYKKRIRDYYGIVVNRNMLQQAAFDQAVRRLETDFLFDQREEEYRQLKKLHFGFNFDHYRGEIRRELKQKNLKSSRRRELLSRLGMLRSNYLELAPAQDAMLQYRQYVGALVAREKNTSQSRFNASTQAPRGTLVRDTSGRHIFTLRQNLPDAWMAVSPLHLASQLAAQTPDQINIFWDRLMLEGAVSSAAYLDVTRQMETERTRLAGHKSYSLEVLGAIRDFRIMLGLQYLRHLGKESGIENTLEPILSFPLGSNVVTLAELVQTYETLISGKRYTSDLQPSGGDGGNGNSEYHDFLSIIDRIETPEGEVLYTRVPAATQVIDPRSSAAVASILQNTVSFGTGRFAKENVRLQSDDPVKEEELQSLNVSVPLLGKTGTANRYRNAAFIGYVPGLPGDNAATMSLDNGYTVGVYTGFDDNKPMVSKDSRISGSAGALPVWSNIASALLDQEKTGDRLDSVDLTFNGLGLRYPDLDQIFVPVDPKQGGVTLQSVKGRRQDIAPEDPFCLSFGQKSAGGYFEPDRYFMPFWRNNLSGVNPQ